MIKKLLVNNRIRAQQVRVIDETGKQLGIMPLREALQMAAKQNLDLIQVADKTEPPVCKLGDYGKYLYKEEKKERLTHKRKTNEIKGIRLTFNISSHDLETRANLAGKFLNKGDRVRVEMPLKGREKALGDFAKTKMNKFLEVLKNIIPIKIERELKREARGLTMIISKNQHAQ
ncbi:MAG: translation initiation factor IF-3 [Candidatus Nealsonbacteria bacterium]|nr:translation initiation factor IF-3 [Candidatus Nealsonbacteria bacterium]